MPSRTVRSTTHIALDRPTYRRTGDIAPSATKGGQPCPSQPRNVDSDLFLFPLHGGLFELALATGRILGGPQPFQYSQQPLPTALSSCHTCYLPIQLHTILHAVTSAIWLQCRRGSTVRRPTFP